MKRSITSTETPTNTDQATNTTKQGPAQRQVTSSMLFQHASNPIYDHLPSSDQLSLRVASTNFVKSWGRYVTYPYLNEIPSLENETRNEKFDRLFAKQQTEVQCLIGNKHPIMNEVFPIIKNISDASLKNQLSKEKAILIANFSTLLALKDKKSEVAFYAREKCLDKINRITLNLRAHSNCRFHDIYLTRFLLNDSTYNLLLRNRPSLDISKNFLTFLPEHLDKNFSLYYKECLITPNQCLALQYPFLKLTGPEASNNNDRLSTLAAALLEAGKIKGKIGAYLAFPTPEKDALAEEMLKLNQMKKNKDYRIEPKIIKTNPTETIQIIRIYDKLKESVEALAQQQQENKSGCKLK